VVSNLLESQRRNVSRSKQEAVEPISAAARELGSAMRAVGANSPSGGTTLQIPEEKKTIHASGTLLAAQTTMFPAPWSLARELTVELGLGSDGLNVDERVGELESRRPEHRRVRYLARRHDGGVWSSVRARLVSRRLPGGLAEDSEPRDDRERQPGPTDARSESTS
jgi:hypothetical protein